jgi:hypothetical protein
MRRYGLSISSGSARLSLSKFSRLLVSPVRRQATNEVLMRHPAERGPCFVSRCRICAAPRSSAMLPAYLQSARSPLRVKSEEVGSRSECVDGSSPGATPCGHHVSGDWEVRASSGALACAIPPLRHVSLAVWLGPVTENRREDDVGVGPHRARLGCKVSSKWTSPASPPLRVVPFLWECDPRRAVRPCQESPVLFDAWPRSRLGERTSHQIVLGPSGELHDEEHVA